MSKPQQRISVTMASEWAIRRPYVYRYMQKEHVDAFFEDGTLRLSSFSAFSKHADEERSDTTEGNGILINIDEEGSGQTVIAAMGQGHDAYVLCGSTKITTDLSEAFSTDSGFRINDPTAFGCIISRSLPWFHTGIEGSCIYKEHKTVDRKAGKIDFESMRIHPDKKELDMGKMFGAVFGMTGDDLFFLKSLKYEHQAEYRLLWSVQKGMADFVEVKCPEAIEVCTRFEDI